eukprot:CAMPEP_0114237594 /NCGR_PEP_ID=MMETSP0058-20121206/7475_1 /TAXON_ID=36894 /ORGANISM="Pyramimonas parkeae, CCMP726" /LENGTH=62 /DNA_ID=CAMNT_0001349649 /DNA_START=310 /DNA_END=498 /DNA_ORIENTATION=+
MSRARAIGTFAFMTFITGAGIAAIHHEQTEERKRLHAGVIRDRELLAMKEEQFRLAKLQGGK